MGKSHFDDLPGDDMEILRLTAEAMNASEYQLFIEAYRAWNGDEPDQSQIDRQFGRYLRHGQIPGFVRHFSRGYLVGHPHYLHHWRKGRERAHRARWLAYLLIAVMVLAALVFY